MRPIESYITYAAMYSVLDGKAPLTGYAGILLVVLLLAHLVIEKLRIQLLIAYATSMYAVYATVVSPEVDISWAGIIIYEMLLFISSAIACLMPVAKFPELSGPYKQIGWIKKAIWHSDDTRALMVDIFYPSNHEVTSKAKPSDYINQLEATALASYGKYPASLFRHITLAKPRALCGVPICNKEKTFPVVILSHGLGGVSKIYTVLAQDIASHGFIVMAPTHNDQSAAIAFPRAKKTDTNKSEPSILRHNPLPQNSDEFKFRHTQLSQRVQECQAIIDCLESDSEETWSSSWEEGKQTDGTTFKDFLGRINLQRICVVGHSFGGATATATAFADKRVRAVVSYDGWMLPIEQKLRSSGLEVPLLMIQSEQWLHDASQFPGLKEMYMASTSKDNRFFTIQGSRHQNFCDLPLFGAFVARKFGAIGSMNHKRFFGMVNAYTAAFLRRQFLRLDDKDKLAAVVGQDKKTGQAISIAITNALLDDPNGGESEVLWLQ